jgi:hypothetical protein
MEAKPTLVSLIGKYGASRQSSALGYAVLTGEEAILVLNACECLFLAEIEELAYNGLRLVVEGRRAEPSEPLHVGDAVISGGTRIAVIDESAAFELVWKKYVANSVMNDSFAAPER